MHIKRHTLVVPGRIFDTFSIGGNLPLHPLRDGKRTRSFKFTMSLDPEIHVESIEKSIPHGNRCEDASRIIGRR